MAQEPKASTLTTPQPITPQNAPEVAITQGCEQYRSLVSKYDWDVNTILAIMRAESSCNPASINYADGHNGCTGSYSLLQVACIHYKEGQDKLDPETNIAVAYGVWQRGGYTPWSVYTNGAYLRYL
jgi:soluble lytic murein transglycosylase-like protein